MAKKGAVLFIGIDLEVDGSISEVDTSDDFGYMVAYQYVVQINLPAGKEPSKKTKADIEVTLK